MTRYPHRPDWIYVLLTACTAAAAITLVLNGVI